MDLSRRDWGKLAAGLISGTYLARAGDTGVRLGACTYSYRALPRVNGEALGVVLDALEKCHVDVCELFSGHLEPEHGSDAKQSREQLREWRLNTPMEHFEQVKKRFQDAGVEIFAYTVNFSKNFTDPELDKCFQQAKALRASVIASSTQVSMLPRLQPLAEKYEIPVAVHGHSDVKHPDEFSSPETFQKALDMSPWFKVNLDIGHFTAADFDAVAYIGQHHSRITHLHLKDRKKNNGPNMPFGEGDTPIKQVLQLLKRKQYPIAALVEYEYSGKEGPIQEVNKCLAYCRAAIAEP